MKYTTSYTFSKGHISSYSFGFNGQLKDNEVYGEGNGYTAEFWEYDPRIGRRWNIDPMYGKYPDQSPYVAFNDNPIATSDPKGLEGEGGPGDKLTGTGGSGAAASLKKRKTEGTTSTTYSVSMTTPNSPSYAASDKGSKEGEYVMDVVEGAKNVVVGMAMPMSVNLTVAQSQAWQGNFKPMTNLTIGGTGYVDLSKEGIEGDDHTKLRVATEIGINLLLSVEAVRGSKSSFAPRDITTTETGNLGNPYKNFNLNEVASGFDKHVQSGKLIPKYTNPTTGAKSYYNTQSGYSYNLDPGGIYGKNVEGPHIDVNYPNPKPKNVPAKKKLQVSGGF